MMTLSFFRITAERDKQSYKTENIVPIFWEMLVVERKEVMVGNVKSRRP